MMFGHIPTYVRDCRDRDRRGADLAATFFVNIGGIT